MEIIIVVKIYIILCQFTKYRVHLVLIIQYLFVYKHTDWFKVDMVYINIKRDKANFKYSSAFDSVSYVYF